MSEIITDPNLLAQLNGTQKEALPPAKPIGEDSTGNKLKRSALGALQGAVLDPLAAVGQFLPENYGGNLANKQLQWYENKRRELGGEGFDPARMAGNVGGTFIPILGAAGKAGQLAKGAGLVKAGALSGAASGALQPVLPAPEGEDQSFAQEKAKQIGGGAVLGGALNKLIGTASPALQNAIFKGKKPTTAEIEKLTPDQKIELYRQQFPDADLTWGQLIGPRANTLEQKLTSAPFVGGTIREARNRALESQNVSMMNKALEPAGISLDKGARAGRGLFEEAQDKLSDQYGKILKDVQLTDPQALRAKIVGKLEHENPGGLPATAEQLASQPQTYTQGVVSNKYNLLSEAGQDKFNSLLEKGLFSKFGKDPQGNKSLSLSGEQFKRHEEDLKDTIDSLMHGGGEDREIGKMLKASLNEAYTALKSSDPAISEQLKKLNKAYAQFKTLETASTSGGGTGGIFTPIQTIRAASKGSRGQVARGQGLLQPESELSQSVLGRAYPDSGTAGRLNLSSPTGLIGGLAAETLASTLYNPSLARLMTGTGTKWGRAFEGTRPGAHLARNAQSYTSAASKANAAGTPPSEEYAGGGSTGPLSTMSSFGFGGGPLTMLNR